jgi:hypothetical protein
MNIDNVSALTAMLVRAGFDENIGYRLLQRICFHPSSFVMIERQMKHKDSLTCVLRFERKGQDYTCAYYDVFLIRGMQLPERVIGGINLVELDTAMDAIDWKLLDLSDSFHLSDTATWAREKAMAQVVQQLTKLSSTVEGKPFADALKVKHWADAGLEELIGNLNALKSKFAISQRVYFIDGDAIPVGEVYRFLLNQWMQKKMQAKRRSEADEGNETDVAPADTARGKHLSPKKKKTRVKRNAIER